MKKIFLIGILFFAVAFNVTDVQAEESKSDIIQSELIDEAYFTEVDSANSGERAEADSRNYRLDSDYYAINDTIVAGMATYENKIDIQAYDLDYTDDNVQKLLTIVTDEVFRDIYYAQSAITVWYSSTSNKIFDIEVAYAYEDTDGLPDIAQCSDLQSRSIITINNAMKLITDEMTDVDKALVLHDYLIEKITYTANDIDQTSGSALANFETVCAGYAKAYSVLLDQVGIENYYVTGLGSGVAHGWNIINIENSYYHVDVTWDDIYGPTSGIINRKYFLMSDAEMLSNRHTDWDVYAPVCVSAKYNQSEFLFDFHRDFGFYNGHFYYLNGTSLKYATMAQTDVTSSAVVVDFSEYEGGDIYKQYVYMYDADTNIINRYDIQTEEVVTVYSYAGTGNINGIEVDDLAVTVSTTDGQMIYETVAGDYYGDITVNVTAFAITETITDSYTIAGAARIVSTYDGSEHKMADIPLIELWNSTDNVYKEFNVIRIDDYNYSFSLTLTSPDLVLNNNDSFIIFEDDSIYNTKTSDTENMNTINSPLGSSNEWRFENVVVNSNEDINTDLVFTLRDKMTQEEVLANFYDYTIGTDGKYKISLTDSFRQKLNNQTNQEYTVEDYTWKTGDALPNPAPDGVYDGVEVTDMSYLFLNGSSIVSLDLSLFNTSNVTDMSGMFNECSSLTSLDLSGFNTAKVTDMNAMFKSCYNLETLDVSGFDTSLVTDMGEMFEDNVSLAVLDIRNFELGTETDITEMFNYNAISLYEEDKFIQGYAKDVYISNRFNDSSVTGIVTEHLEFEGINKEYVGNINSELIDLQIFPIDDGTGDYVISGKVVVVEWVDGVSTVPDVAPVMSFKGEFGDNLEVFVTAEGTNTYYFDRRIGSSGLVDGQNFRFEITSGNQYNIGEYKSMYLYLSTSPNVEQSNSFRIADTKSISYEMDYQGQLIIFNEDDPYDYIGNINSELISLDIVPVDDGTGDVVITGEVIVVEWVNGSDPMGDPNDDPKSTVPREKPSMSFVASDGTGSLEVWVTALGTNTYYFDRRISGEGLTDGKQFNFNIKSGNERNLSEYNAINLYLSTSNGVEKYRQYTLPSGKVIHYYETTTGELEISNYIAPTEFTLGELSFKEDKINNDPETTKSNLESYLDSLGIIEFFDIQIVDGNGITSGLLLDGYPGPGEYSMSPTDPKLIIQISN